MTEQLFYVSAKHKTTGEKIRLDVWAENVDEATRKFAGILFGYDCEYTWTGSGPYYKNNKVITREVIK